MNDIHIIGRKQLFEIRLFSHFSSSENHFPRIPGLFSPVIGGIFVSISGLRFSFRALEAPDLRVRKGLLSKVKLAFSSLSDQALPVAIYAFLGGHNCLQICG